MQFAFADVYTALQVGSTDGAVLPIDSSFAGSGFRDLFRSYVDQPYQPVIATLTINQGLWQRLSHASQLAIAGAARAIQPQLRQRVAAQDEAFRGSVLASGAQLTVFSAEDVQTAREASLRSWSTSQKGPQAEYAARALAAARAVAAPQHASRQSIPARHEILFATDRVPEEGGDLRVVYGSSRDLVSLHFGRADIELKAGRQVSSDLTKYADILSFERLQDASFESRLRAAVQNPRSRIVVFMHGYNNSLTDAVFRAATIKHDIAPDDVVVAFSWPSEGLIQAYFRDAEAINTTAQNFRKFVTLLDRVAPRSRIRIIAHSMGGRILVNYFDWAHGRPEFVDARKFGELVFVASDIGVDHFRQKRELLETAAARVTVYLSAYDRPLFASEVLQGPRVGRKRANSLFVDGEVETVDASAIDGPSGFLGISFALRHSYVFDKAAGVEDLAELLAGRSADTRTKLVGRQHDGRSYWELQAGGG